MDEPRPTERWWQTVPGMLTAAAGLITAITGLVVAVQQMWPSSRQRDMSATSAPVLTTQPATIAAPAAQSYRVSLPKGSSARFAETYVYDVLRASATRTNPGELDLRLTVRLTNNDRYDANLWSSTFRLVVDGSARAPTGELDDVIAAGSAGEGEVAFTLPASSHSVVLVVQQQNAKVRLPLVLRPA